MDANDNQNLKGLLQRAKERLSIFSDAESHNLCLDIQAVLGGPDQIMVKGKLVDRYEEIRRLRSLLERYGIDPDADAQGWHVEIQ